MITPRSYCTFSKDTSGAATLQKNKWCSFYMSWKQGSNYNICTLSHTLTHACPQEEMLCPNMEFTKHFLSPLHQMQCLCLNKCSLMIWAHGLSWFQGNEEKKTQCPSSPTGGCRVAKCSPTESPDAGSLSNMVGISKWQLSVHCCPAAKWKQKGKLVAARPWWPVPYPTGAKLGTRQLCKEQRFKYWISKR